MCRFAWRGRFLVVCSRKRHCYHRRVQGTPAPALNFFFFFFFFYLLPSRQPSIPLSFGLLPLTSFFLVPNAYERRLPGTVRRCSSHIKFNESSFSFSSKATLNLYYKQFNRDTPSTSSSTSTSTTLEPIHSVAINNATLTSSLSFRHN